MGFNERLYRLYKFDTGVDPELYLSHHSTLSAKAMLPDREILSRKDRFYDYLADRGYSQYLPEIFGQIRGGAFESATGSPLDRIVRRTGRVVVKEVEGLGGYDVFVGDWDDGEITLRGRNGEVGSLKSKMANFDRAIVTEYCEQADYLDAIYPDAANTIRLIAMNPDRDDAFIAGAVQRLGTSQTGVLDNVSQGGLTANIDLETGELSAAAAVLGERPGFHPTHPDTGSQIEGMVIPEWPSIKRNVLAVVNECPELKYAGLDLLVTAPGKFVLLEGNHYPDTDIHQVHRPLLADRRIREFFTNNGIPV